MPVIWLGVVVRLGGLLSWSGGVVTGYRLGCCGGIWLRVAWMAGQWRPKRAPSPVSAPIAGRKPKGGLRQAVGSAGWLSLAFGRGLAALPAVVPASGPIRSVRVHVARTCGSPEANGTNRTDAFPNTEYKLAIAGKGLRTRKRFRVNLPRRKIPCPRYPPLREMPFSRQPPPNGISLRRHTHPGTGPLRQHQERKY